VPNTRLLSSSPTADGTAWTVGVQNNSGQSLTAIGYAICETAGGAGPAAAAPAVTAQRIASGN
jgi:hypothetical protein